ncbi:MAG TPA: 4-alpha-glucanotransferase [Dissulfurispiraceae bacterium]|nr:4-alpha-glucanotransferase [Dissulfurispiraceae bacterium]
MQNYDELIDQLSDICGIVPEYWDTFGNRHIAPIATKKALLKAMKIDVDSTESLAAALDREQCKTWRSFIEPVKVLSVNAQPFTIAAYVPINGGEEHRLTLSCSLEDEYGQREELSFAGDSLTVKEQQMIGGSRYVKFDLTDKGFRDIGYYRATVICRHPKNIFPGGSTVLEKTCRIIIAPDTCYIPPELENGRTWGLSMNLYSLRSSRNWGVGDFTDLKTIIRFTAALKSGFAGINPLHAIPNIMPCGISPYSPISRFYKNFIYLDINAVPEVNESGPAQETINSDVFKEALSDAINGDLVEYEKIAFMKKSVLKLAFDFFYQGKYEIDSPRSNAFKKYIADEGAALDSFALFSALWEHMKNVHQAYIWQDWPEEFLNPGGEAVREFRALHENDLLFHKYLQWLADEQHRETAELAFSLGMPIGIYHDLAIGSTGGGCDSWHYQGITAGGVDVGAPPDAFNPNGQNWAFPPVISGRLKETGYDFFIRLIAKNMKYNGALRIDHALGLFRLFWIPAGLPAEKGAYVTCPEEDLLRIIALESVRNKTMVIAEDLGTVGENVHEALLRFGMLSYRLFYFERNYPDPSFRRPEQYPPMALCSITTHDLPTVYGYWSGRDLQVKKQLNMFHDSKLMQQCLNDRERDRMLMLDALKSQGLVPYDFPLMPVMSPELCLAIYEYLARTSSKLVAVSLDDIIGTVDQQNIPGITGSYPNWMQKTPASLEQMAADQRFYALSDMFRKNKR